MRRRSIIVAGTAAAVLAAGSIGAFAATRGGSASPGWSSMHGRIAATSCTVPTLPGRQVTVMLGDMGGVGSGSGMMGGSAMMGGAGMMGAPGISGASGFGWAMIHPVPRLIAAGTVSLVALNRGTTTHELVVLPLSAGATVGQRTVGPGDTVSEDGSLGEASKSCGGGAGDGITSGSAGWVTLTLKPGRYELICNLPGHYAAGMYAELDIAA